MRNAVTDTHALIWYLEDSSRLSSAANQAFDRCDKGEIVVYIPTICIVEIVYLQECPLGGKPFSSLGSSRKVFNECSYKNKYKRRMWKNCAKLMFDFENFSIVQLQAGQLKMAVQANKSGKLTLILKIN